MSGISVNEERMKPNNIAKSVYRFLISLRLSVILLLLLTADLFVGYIFLHGNASFYEPMNEVGLRQWLMTYGLAQPFLSAWFFALLFLLFCLVVNTSLCTYDKLHSLFTSGRISIGSRRVRFTLSIHLMHVAMVLLLAGYLISYTTAEIHNSLTIMRGGSITVPGSSIKLELTSMGPVPYSGTRNQSYIGRYVDTEATIRIDSGDMQEEKVLSLNKPIFHNNYSLFLQRFNPRYKGGMSTKEYIIIDIRKDPGVHLTFIGMAAFMIGYFGYLLFRSPLRTQRRPAQ